MPKLLPLAALALLAACSAPQEVAGTPDPEGCHRLMESFKNQAIDGPMPMRSERDFGEAFDSIVKVNKLAAERTRLGCDRLDSQQAFASVSSEMRMDGGGGGAPGVSFEPGKPMVDTRAADDPNRWRAPE